MGTRRKGKKTRKLRRALKIRGARIREEGRTKLLRAARKRIKILTEATKLPPIVRESRLLVDALTLGLINKLKATFTLNVLCYGETFTFDNFAELVTSLNRNEGGHLLWLLGPSLFSRTSHHALSIDFYGIVRSLEDIRGFKALRVDLGSNEMLLADSPLLADYEGLVIDLSEISLDHEGKVIYKSQEHCALIKP